MLVTAIEPLESLTAVETELVDEMLDDHPELARADLVVYRLAESGGRRTLVAPTNELMEPGMTVVTVGWSEAVQIASSDDPVATELHLAGALAPDDLPS